MIGKSCKGLFCLSLVVTFFAVSASNQRSPLGRVPSPRLIRAAQTNAIGAESDSDLNPKQETVCSGAPDFSASPQPAPGIHSVNPQVFERDRATAVFSLIRYPWQGLGYEIVFMGFRPGYRAMTLTAKHRIEIYIRPEENPMDQAYDLAHELGHAFDLKYNNDERRRKWCELRGIKPSTPWFGCDACPDYRTPAGDFAETFAFLLLGPGNYHSLMAPIPRMDQVEELAEFCRIDHLSETLLANLQKTSARDQAFRSANRNGQKEKLQTAAQTIGEPVSAAVPETVVRSEKPTEAIYGAEGRAAEIKSITRENSPAAQAPRADAPASGKVIH